MATLQSLLKWGIDNATRGEDAPVLAAGSREPLQPIDPKWIEAVLGKPDAARIREAMDTAVNSNKTYDLDTRLAALDEMELLVESIDNAKDLRPLGLWIPLLEMLSSDSDPEIRTNAAWVVTTSLQNNPEAVDAFLDLGGVDVLATAIEQEQNASVMVKLTGIVSALTSQHANLIGILYDRHVLSILASMLLPSSKNATVSSFRKQLHMFADIIVTVPSIANLFRNTIDAIVIHHVDILTTSQNEGNDNNEDSFDIDMVEKLLHFVSTCWEANVRLGDHGIKAVKQLLSTTQEHENKEQLIDKTVLENITQQIANL